MFLHRDNRDLLAALGTVLAYAPFDMLYHSAAGDDERVLPYQGFQDAPVDDAVGVVR